MKYFFFFVLFIFSAPLSAQNEDVIEYLNASEFNGKVLLSWSIMQGNTCNGIQILHSTDSMNFSQISSIEGICGSTQQSISYSFTDLSPEKNANNYYRLQLGGLGFSWIVSVEVIDLGMNTSIVRPNPLSKTSELLFDNEANFEVFISVYSSSGVLVNMQSTVSEQILLEKSKYTAGLYHYVLTSEESGVFGTGKFVVP
ncbi:MAG: T9SS type A sorting domain-containing protein [Crocinitomicaceae bacterium]|nr:T9SS type A sorting domain-containing protein [Crocinitomicaceae bacterium]